ncbi:hypothetical protein BSAF29S_01583 [Bacillus safensis subsp. safensis]
MQDAENLQKIEQTYEDIHKKTAEASKMSTVKQAKNLLDQISEKNYLYYTSTNRLFNSLNMQNQKEFNTRLIKYNLSNKKYIPLQRVRSKSAKTT